MFHLCRSSSARLRGNSGKNGDGWGEKEAIKLQKYQLLIPDLLTEGWGEDSSSKNTPWSKKERAAEMKDQGKVWMRARDEEEELILVFVSVASE